MMHIALRTTTASGAQALAVMCGARMCCCCRPCWFTPMRLWRLKPQW